MNEHDRFLSERTHARRRFRHALATRPGFSLIELGVVVAIMGVLTMVAIASFRGVQSRATDKDAQTSTRVALDALAAVTLKDAVPVFPSAEELTAALAASEPSLGFTTGVSSDAHVVSVARVSDSEVLLAAPTFKGNCWIVDYKITGQTSYGGFDTLLGLCDAGVGAGHLADMQYDSWADTTLATIPDSDCDLYRSEVLGDNPVAYWRLDSPADSGPYGFTGTVHAPLIVGTGASAVCADASPNASTLFLGAGYLDFGNPPELQLTQDATLEMWLRPAVGHMTDARRNPFNKAYGGEMTVTQEKTGVLDYYQGSCGGNCNPYLGFGTPGMVEGEWRYVVLVRDVAANTLSWYVDGAFVSSRANNPGAAASSKSVWIGDGYVYPYHGEIDEVAMYAHALTADDIAAHWAAAGH